MEHAGRNELNVKDIKLAVKENTDEISKCRLPFKVLLVTYIIQNLDYNFTITGAAHSGERT